MTRDDEAPPGAALPKPGDAFEGKYRIERVIGQGAMAVVFEATHLQLQDRVAIKVLLPQWAASAESVERFMREGRAATRIRSEHVVRVFDVGVSGGHPYLVMEHLDGSDLDHVLEQAGRMSVPVAVDYVLQACEAIAEAHARGIVHRDLKPANLFLTRRADGSACVKVLDFGISKAAESEGPDGRATSPSTVMGSPNYMSPEQMLSSRNVDARSDIWSLGAILHELLASSPPFDGDTFAALSAAILRDAPPKLTAARPDVPPQIEAIVRRCLEKEPAQRYANVAELAAALAPFGSPAAHASAERIARVLDAGTGKISMPVPAQSALPAPRPAEHRTEGAVALLAEASAPAHARSRGLGYVVAAAAFVVIGATIVWMVMRNDHAREAAEAAASPSTSATASPSTPTTVPTLTSAGASAVMGTVTSPPHPPPSVAPATQLASAAPSSAAVPSRPSPRGRWPRRAPRIRPPAIPPLPDFPVPTADPQGEPASVPIAPLPPAASSNPPPAPASPPPAPASPLPAPASPPPAPASPPPAPASSAPPNPPLPP